MKEIQLYDAPNLEHRQSIKNNLDGNIIYANTQKSPVWANNGRLQLPRSLLKQSLSVELSIAQQKQNSKYNQTEKGAYDPETNVISLFQGSDPSTVIHETWHFFIEQMYSAIARGEASQQVINDFDKLLSCMMLQIWSIVKADRGLYTFFKPTDGKAYYDEMKEEDLKNGGSE